MRAQQAMKKVRMNQVLVLGFEHAASASSDVLSERAECCAARAVNRSCFPCRMTD
jgi:hypothetical protein